MQSTALPEDDEILREFEMYTEEDLKMSEEERIEKLRLEIELLGGTIKDQERKTKIVTQQAAGEVNIKRLALGPPQVPGLETTSSNKSFPSTSFQEQETKKSSQSHFSAKKKTTKPSFDDDTILTRDQLTILVDELKEQILVLEDEGYYVEAEMIHFKIQELYFTEASKIEQAFNKACESLRLELLSVFALDMEAFDKTWSDKTSRYDRQAKDLVRSTLERQSVEYEKAYQILRSQLHLNKPKFSKAVLDQRSKILTLLKTKDYKLAEKARKELGPMELKEIDKFEKHQEEKLKKKMITVETKHKQEMEALHQRINSSKAQLERDRKLEHKKITQTQNNIFQEFENKMKRIQSLTRQFVTKLEGLITNNKKSVSSFFETLPKDLDTFHTTYTELIESLKREHERNYSHLYINQKNSSVNKSEMKTEESLLQVVHNNDNVIEIVSL